MNMLNLNPDTLLLTSDVARLFAVSGETVRQWEKSGRLAARRTVSGARIISGCDVLRLQEQRSAASRQVPEVETVGSR